jgi:hypothetical protein
MRRAKSLRKTPTIRFPGMAKPAAFAPSEALAEVTDAIPSLHCSIELPEKRGKRLAGVDDDPAIALFDGSGGHSGDRRQQ